MSNRPLVYVVEDEADLGQLICTSLARYNMESELLATGSALRRQIKARKPDLCLIDLNLPDMDGMELVRELQQERIGIIIVSGRDALADRVLGLEFGADDYLPKPFEPRELVARVQSLLRRIRKTETATQVIATASFGGWVYNPATFTLSQNGSHETLSLAEHEMLMALLNNPFRIVSRDNLIGANQVAYDRSIDVRMSRLRKKLEALEEGRQLIKTVYGAGYMLACEVVWGR